MAALGESVSAELINGLHLAGTVVGERGPGACQDRAAIIPTPEGIVIVLADGAGGLGGGALAADAVISAVAAACAAQPSELSRPNFWSDVLAVTDSRLAGSDHGGQATAVVCAVGRDIVGASVGDSVGWLVHGPDNDDLTSEQVKRPLIGSGQATISPIAGELGGSTLLVASDGLAKYAPRTKIVTLANTIDLAQGVDRLIGLVRLRSGALQDDVSVVLCRRQSPTGG